MRTLSVDLGERSYPIHIGSGLLSDQERITSCLDNRRAVLITDDTVATHYLQPLARNWGIPSADQLVLPAGETNKNLATLSSIFDFLLEKKCDRKTILIALGGGVVGDMVGFAAACYQRGIEFIQVPTTLLAQVDSSVGGKTGINHPAGKNMIGAFHQPKAVFIDTDTLTTLPPREISAGLAEVIKYGLISDAELLAWLEDNLERLQGLEADALAHAIERSCATKAAVVSSDETEQGRRAILNLGHTFGHAVETATGYQSWLHGEAVGLGMRMALNLSATVHALPADQIKRVNKLLDRAGLPARLPPASSPDELLKLIYADKKTDAGTLTFITLDTIGNAVINRDITDEQVLQVIRQFL